MAAAQFAHHEQLPLNRHTTIHFDVANISEPVLALGRMFKLMSDWLRTRGASFAYLWVREAGPQKGEHVHILMHVPPHLTAEFAHRERGWRSRVGARRALGAFRSRPIGHSYRHAKKGLEFGETYSDHLRKITGYLIKGADGRSVKALELTRVEDGGELWGKRCGMSQNIGRSARLKIEQ